jgi:hypothetical protein
VRSPKRFDAWQKGRENAGEEPADVAIDLFSLAGMTGSTGKMKSRGRPGALNWARLAAIVAAGCERTFGKWE